MEARTHDWLMAVSWKKMGLTSPHSHNSTEQVLNAHESMNELSWTKWGHQLKIANIILHQSIQAQCDNQEDHCHPSEKKEQG